MNPAKNIRKNPLKFEDDPILPLWINQAKTIQLMKPRKIPDDTILPLWMNQAKTIQLNPRKVQNDPILPLWMNPLKLQMTLFCRCGIESS